MTTETAVSTDVRPVTIQELAQNAVKSGMYKDMANAEQAVMKIYAGRELGLTPLFSLQRLLIVNGQITIEGEAILYLWARDGYRWERLYYNNQGQDVADDKATDKAIFGCAITIWGPDGKLLTKNAKGETTPATFDLARAAQAGLLTKDNWRKYPERMLFYRCVGFGARDYTPGVTGGMITSEEMKDVELASARPAKITVSGQAPNVDGQPAISAGGVCPIHSVPFEEKRGRGGAIWFSHKTDDGKWCNQTSVGQHTPKQPEATPGQPPQEIQPTESNGLPFGGKYGDVLADCWVHKKPWAVDGYGQLSHHQEGMQPGNFCLFRERIKAVAQEMCGRIGIEAEGLNAAVKDKYGKQMSWSKLTPDAQVELLEVLYQQAPHQGTLPT